MKTRLQIKLDNMDPFEAIKKLMIAGKVSRANVVDFERIVIYYDSRKISETELKGIIGLNESDGEKLKSIINVI
jgi:phosphomannomutase